MSLASRGGVPPGAAFALVLGASLGAAINPVLEGAAGNDPVAKRLPIGNLVNRAIGVIAGLALLHPVELFIVTFEADNARAVADFHTLFNVSLALVFLPCLVRTRPRCDGGSRRGSIPPIRRNRFISIRPPDRHPSLPLERQRERPCA
jgi:hypothetical protein